MEDVAAAAERALQGNLHKEAAKLERQGKLFVRDRLALLLDEGSFVEDALLANASHWPGRPARRRRRHRHRRGSRVGRSCVVANDPTVKAGSWGARTVEKIVRATEYGAAPRAAGVLARRLGRRPHHRPGRSCSPAAGARAGSSTTRCGCRAGCPRSAACSGRARPAAPTSRASATSWSWSRATPRCTSGSPRMAEVVINEQTTLEEMGGARMHATVSGCGDNLAVDDADAIDQAKAYFGYLPSIVAGGRRRPTSRRRPARAVRRRPRSRPRSRSPTTCTR